jgi:hypothetical protein
VQALREVHDAFDAWRRADTLAGEVERQVRAAAVQELEGTGSPPSEELRRRARELREHANGLFKQAIDVMSPARRSQRTGPIDETGPS